MEVNQQKHPDCQKNPEHIQRIWRKVSFLKKKVLHKEKKKEKNPNV